MNNNNYTADYVHESSTVSYTINRGFSVRAKNILQALEHFQLEFPAAVVESVKLQNPSKVFKYMDLEDIKEEDKHLIYDIKTGMKPPQASLHLINYWKYHDPIIEVPSLSYIYC